MYSFQFNLKSKWSHGYFTASVWGTMVWLMLTAGQWPFRSVNFMWDDLDSLTLIFHFCSHFSMMCKCSWRLSEVIVESSWVTNIVVSSANVPNVVSLDVGKSDVCSTYRRGPRMLLWGTPEWMWKRLEVSQLNFVSNWISFRYDFSRLKYLEDKILLILSGHAGFHTLSNPWLTSKNCGCTILLIFHSFCWWRPSCGGVVKLWSGPIGIQIDGLGSSLAG